MHLHKPLYIIPILLLFSCEKRPDNTPLSQPVIKAEASPKMKRASEKTYSSCEEFISILVKSSNAASFKSFKDIQIRIENITPEKITIELYVSVNISEDAATQKITDHAVGWLEFYPSTQKLQDITYDIENPEILQYDTNLLKKTDIGTLCQIKN